MQRFRSDRRLAIEGTEWFVEINSGEISLSYIHEFPMTKSNALHSNPPDLCGSSQGPDVDALRISFTGEVANPRFVIHGAGLGD